MDNPQNNNDQVRQTEPPVCRIPADERNMPVANPVAPDDNNGKNVYPVEQKDNIVNNEQTKNNILDIFYGVLFEPARTFAGFAPRPPVIAIVIIFVALSLAESLTSILTTPVYLDKLNLDEVPGLAGAGHFIQSFGTAAVFLFGIIKWFFMAGLLHLLAELYGGSGSARGVFTVYGAAALPAVFMIPVQIIMGLVDAGQLFDFVTGLLTLGLYVWGIILLIIGLREVHHLSTGRAVLTVMTPWLMLLSLVLVTVIFIATVASNTMSSRII